MTTPIDLTATTHPLTFVVLCPHFDPDTAPTGVVMTRIVRELAAHGHRLHVVTSLPWYRTHRVEEAWQGNGSRVETTAWGTITRVQPFASADKRNLLRRALGFAGFSLLVGWKGLRAGGPRRVDCVLAMSPPLTLGLTGWLVHLWRRGPLVFNVQDIFPDAAVESGAISRTSRAGRLVLGLAGWVERLTYRRSAAVTVLSDDLADNVRAKLPAKHRGKVRVIPNFVDVDAIQPAGRSTAYRRDLGIGDEPVVLYAGNVGFSQSLELVVAAAAHLPDATFVIHGEGSAKATIEAAAQDLANVRFSPYLPSERLPEVLASGDVHIVPLRTGLGSVSVPSKTYSILAAGRPVVAAIDPGTEVPRILAASGGGVAVAPDDAVAFTEALRGVLSDLSGAAEMGAAGRRWVEGAVSPAAVARAYEQVVAEAARNG